MYTWVSSESWLLLGIVSLILFLWKGIDYSQEILSPRNRILVFLIPMSVLQILISYLEISSLYVGLQNTLTNILMIYGTIFVGYIFYLGYKNSDTKEGTIRDIYIIIFAILMYLGAEVYDCVFK